MPASWRRGVCEVPTPVILPKMEMSQETATLVEWLKTEGMVVQKGEPLFVVETDKVTVEVEAPANGVLVRITAEPGQTLPVTTVIAQLLQPGESLPEPPAETPARPAARPQETKSNGGPARAGMHTATPLAARMADSEGLDLAQIPGSGPGGQVTRADVARLLAAGRGKVRATPAARRIAREQQVPLEQVAGSGPRGRIQGRDVLAYQAAPHTTTAPEPAAGDWTVVPFEGMRRTIAERMVASYQSAPHITFTARVDFTEFEAARARLNQRAEREDAPRFSVTALLVQLAARALRSHPMLNARLVNTAEQTEIHLMHAVNIGVAVALPEGLIVPVVRDADRKAGREIAAEVQQLAAKAREGRLAPGDVVGGTFTISNLGPFGVEQFTAILNPGQTGILAVGAAVREPVAVGNEVQIRPMVHLTLAVDHRVVDGAVAAHFLADLRALLETPSLVLW